MKIAEADASVISGLCTKVNSKVQQAKTLSGASEALTREIYNQFGDSVVLARCFVTVPFGDLPTTNKEFVQSLAKSAGADKALKEYNPSALFVGHQRPGRRLEQPEQIERPPWHSADFLGFCRCHPDDIALTERAWRTPGLDRKPRLGNHQKNRGNVCRSLLRRRRRTGYRQ